MSNRWWAINTPLINPAEDGSTNASENQGTHPNQSGDNEEFQSPGAGGAEISEPPNSYTGRRPRGRPPGSKNKPKPPTIITRDSPNSLRSHVLDILSGTDILESIAAYARRRHCGVLILSCVGNVSHLILRQLGGDERQFHGRFQIISLHGSFLPASTTADASGLTALIAGPRGELAGGAVRGPMVADGPVMVIASTFTNATFERLPLEEDVQVQPTTGGASAPSSVVGDTPAPTLFNLLHTLIPNGYVPPPPPSAAAGHDVFWSTPPPRTRAPY